MSRKSQANTAPLSRKPRRKQGSCPSCSDTEFVAAATLLEDKCAEETPESRESEFSCDYTNKGRKISTHSERTTVPQSPYQSNIVSAVSVARTGVQCIEADA